MKILDPGHRYVLEQLDTAKYANVGKTQTLRFVKHVGDHYPGNVSPVYEGTTTQEVLRALIDRTKYVDKQIHSDHNDTVIVPTCETCGHVMCGGKHR